MRSILPIRQKTFLLLGLVLAFFGSSARAAGSVVRIKIHGSETISPRAIEPIALPAMSLAGPATVYPSLAPIAPEFRIRGVASAPEQPRAEIAEISPIALAGGAALSANALGQGISDVAGGSALKQREAIAGAFDDGPLMPQDVDVSAEPITAGELFGSGQSGFVSLPAQEAERLAALADQTARLRAIRATRGESELSPAQAAVLAGIDDLARAVAIGHTTPTQLAEDVGVAERMKIKTLRRFSKLAREFIRTDVKDKSTPGARVGNVEHVEQQLIEPLTEDGAALARGL